MFISPFLDVRPHYQSPAMPRCHVAAFAILKVEWIIQAVKLMLNGKKALNLDDPLSSLKPLFRYKSHSLS